VNQRTYKTVARQAHVLTRTRYFYRLNVIISHSIVYKEGLGYLSVCAIASRSSPPSLPPKCVFVTVIQTRCYFVSIVTMFIPHHHTAFFSMCQSKTILQLPSSTKLLATVAANLLSLPTILQIIRYFPKT
jgi:hypothetical protein